MNPVFLNCRIRIQFFFLVVWIRINSIRIRNPDVSAQPTTEMINHFSKNRKATMWIRMQYKPPDPNLVYMNDRILIQKNLSNLKLWIFFLFFVEYGYNELRCFKILIVLLQFTSFNIEREDNKSYNFIRSDPEPNNLSPAPEPCRKARKYKITKLNWRKVLLPWLLLRYDICMTL